LEKMNTFWALEIEPNKVYSQIPPADLHITQAALDAKATSKERVVIQCSVDGGTFTLGSLRLGQVEQFPLDIFLDPNVEVKFHVTGNSSVHLVGYYLDSQDDDDENDFDEFDEELMLEEGLSGDEEEEGEEEEDPEIIVKPSSDKKQKKVTLQTPTDVNKKRKNEVEVNEPKENPNKKTKQATPAKIDEKNVQPTPEGKSLSKKEKRKLKKEEQEQEQVTPEKQNPTKVNGETPRAKTNGETPSKKSETPAKKSETPAKEVPTTPKATGKAKETPAKTPKTPTAAVEESDSSRGTPLKEPIQKKLPNGLVIEDIVIGSGALAEPGKKASVKYTGRLPNGKVFDSSQKRPFSFRLGTNSVIKGWEMGVKGMKVGGKRKLIIPPSLAYGTKGAPPDIPPNSTLHFDIELVDI